MALFGISFGNTLGAHIYLAMRNKALQAPDIIKMPFNGKIKVYAPGFAIVEIKPMFPNIPFYAGLALMLMDYVFPSLWLSILFLAALIASFLWSSEVQYLALKLGMRKAGYEGKLSLLSDKETLRRLHGAI